tara:strand:- start:2722 stop:3222 length:501 start_codon:yes stop_codon:yes gene_type:complete
MDENKIGGNMSVSQASNVMKEFSMVGKRQAVKDQFAGLSGFGAGLMDFSAGLSTMTGVHGMVTGVQNFMMTPEQRFAKGIDTLTKNAETINTFIDKIPQEQKEKLKKAYGFDNDFSAVRKYLSGLESGANKKRNEFGIPIPDESLVDIFLQSTEQFVPADYFQVNL